MSATHWMSLNVGLEKCERNIGIPTEVHKVINNFNATIRHVSTNYPPHKNRTTRSMEYFASHVKKLAVIFTGQSSPSESTIHVNWHSLPGDSMLQ